MASSWICTGARGASLSSAFWATMSMRCPLAARVRTALVVLNSKYFPGLRRLDGIWANEMLALAMWAPFYG